MRYAEAVPFLVRGVEESPLGKGWQDNPERLVRFLHYNVYTVPWRSVEILDVFSRYTGRASLSGMRVLDLGCGLGAMDLYLVLEGRAELVMGVDQQSPLLCIMEKVLSTSHVDRLRLVQGDLSQPPVTPGFFDLVLSYDSLYYAGVSKEEALRQAHASLRPGGVLVIKVVNRLFPPFALAALPGVRLLIRRLFRPLERSGRSYSLVQPNAPSSLELVRMLRRRGFQEVKAYNRYTRSPSGWLRWYLPDVIVVGRHA